MQALLVMGSIDLGDAVILVSVFAAADDLSKRPLKTCADTVVAVGAAAAKILDTLQGTLSPTRLHPESPVLILNPAMYSSSRMCSNSSTTLPYR